MVYLTRRERFAAAHRLWVEDWTEEENKAAFGNCKNLHGHNYLMYVTVKGTPDPVTGFIIDIKDLSKILKEVIIKKVDHAYLNEDVDFIPRGVQPTVENLLMLFWKELEPHLNGCKLHCIKIYETENIYGEYYGE